MELETKQLVWYLPSGAGGIAAGYKAMNLRQKFYEWANGQDIDHRSIKHESFIDYSDNQKKFFRLIMSEKIAIIFMLTWTGERPLKITDYSL